MISLKKAMDEKKFDSRLIELMLQRGKITEKEYQEYLAALPDLQENAGKISVEDLVKLQAKDATH